MVRALTHFGGSSVSCYTAYNPIGQLVAGGTGTSGLKYRFGNGDRTVALMQRQQAIQGGLAVLANNSLVGSPRSLAGGADYQMMYDKHIAARAATPPTAISFQSETLARIEAKNAGGGSVPHTLDMAIAWGATRVEIPSGCTVAGACQYPVDYITPALAATKNDSFWSNAGGLVAP